MGSLKARVLHSRYMMALRHQRNAIRHVTAKKILNVISNEIEFRRRKTVLSSRPYFIKIEPSGTCQLRCPGCDLGTSESGRYNKEAMLSVEGCKLIVDALSDVLLGVSLAGLGESLLNPHLLEMVAYCHQQNVGTMFPTNLSVRLSQDEIEMIVSAGLDHLIVSIDGTTQEVYEKYRRGGNLSLVLQNAAAIIAAKRRAGSRNPFMEFKFALFDHNREQLAEAERLSASMGFDKFSVILDNASPLMATTMKHVRSKNLSRSKACYWPWNSAVVRWDGIVWPCCTSHVVMGNIYEAPLAEIWNSEKYRNLRSFFMTHNCDEDTGYCFRCMKF